MNKKQADPSIWGFVSTDGKFLPISSLTVSNLEYASKSVIEMQKLIADYKLTEEYEKCAVIYNEILKRSE